MSHWHMLGMLQKPHQLHNRYHQHMHHYKSQLILLHSYILMHNDLQLHLSHLILYIGLQQPKILPHQLGKYNPMDKAFDRIN